MRQASKKQTSGRTLLSLLRSERGEMPLSESIALKVVSLILALILWITVLGFKREEVRENVVFDPALPPGMMITNHFPRYIQFTLSGPRVWLKDAEKRIQPIRPDLRRRREPMIEIPISDDLIGELPAGVRVTSFYPSQILLRLEEVTERYISVSPTLQGEPAAGYEVTSIKTTPSKVAVSGPKSGLEALESVGTEPIDIQELKGTKEIDVEVQVENSQGFQLSRDKVVHVKVTTKKVREE